MGLSTIGDHAAAGALRRGPVASLGDTRVSWLDELKIPPGNDLHALKGDQTGRHTIDVNAQYRITFRWEGHDAVDVCCEDYH